MQCRDFQNLVSLYVDAELEADQRLLCERHLESCPVCRSELVQTKQLTKQLARLPAVDVPVDLSSTIRQSMAIEMAAAAAIQPQLNLSHLMIWLRPFIAPYAVGAVVSTVLFLSMFAALRASLQSLHRWEPVAPASIASTRNTGFDVRYPISSQDLAARRAEFSAESPSMNPKGALAALTLSKGDYDTSSDDDMIVVADVFSSGIATLADVLQRPRNLRMVDDVQKAFRTDPAFVPAALDRRPRTVRVVLVIQRIDVSDKRR